MNEAEWRLNEILWGGERSRRSKIVEENRRFVHYTSTDVAVNIIENRAVWMRNASVMNDFREMEHGQNCYRYAFYNGAMSTFRDYLEKHHPGIISRLSTAMSQSHSELRFSTYLTSLSEHDDTEDVYGRLSMWRAYGRQNGVALVLNPAPFLPETDALGAFSSAVAYETPGTFFIAFDLLASEIMSMGDSLAKVSFDFLLHNLYNHHRFAVLTTKHPGFAEEREWRIFHSPDLQPSSVLERDHRVIDGVYQTIYKIPLISDPTKGLHSASIPEVIDRIIIGPSTFPNVTHRAFVDLLRRHNVPDPEAKVFVSDIPLRR